MNDAQSFISCQWCPRQCGVDRQRGETGFCGETAQLRVAAIEAHFGEEPPISGMHGSGTVFFSGCTLQCDFCQNYQLSHLHFGEQMTVAAVVERLATLYRTQGIHNVNFVTPDHFFPYTVAIMAALRQKNTPLPSVYNLSGYERVDALRQIEAAADIYLPDFKYADRELGALLSHCRDYPAVALDAIAEMVRQKGFLDSFLAEEPERLAQRGVLVRHLILPGQTANSLAALDMLFLEFGKNLPLSLMSQYHPVRPCPVPGLDRRITTEEFQQVHDHALSLGFQHVFVQYPENEPPQAPEFLPDFTQARPFQGNVRPPL